MSEVSDELPKVWVLSWCYHDRSGGGLIRAFDDEGKARDMHSLLIKHTGCDREYMIDPVECVRDY